MQEPGRCPLYVNPARHCFLVGGGRGGEALPQASALGTTGCSNWKCVSYIPITKNILCYKISLSYRAHTYCSMKAFKNKKKYILERDSNVFFIRWSEKTQIFIFASTARMFSVSEENNVEEKAWVPRWCCKVSVQPAMPTSQNSASHCCVFLDKEHD